MFTTLPITPYQKIQRRDRQVLQHQFMGQSVEGVVKATAVHQMFAPLHTA